MKHQTNNANQQYMSESAIGTKVPKCLFWCRSVARKHLQNVLYNFEGNIKNLNDLFGEREASVLFLIFGKKMSKQMKTDTKTWIGYIF